MRTQKRNHHPLTFLPKKWLPSFTIPLGATTQSLMFGAMITVYVLCCAVFRLYSFEINAQGGHVRDSFQYPAQTFYDDLPSFVERFGNVRRVIFYCSSSKGRGPRCAGW